MEDHNYTEFYKDGEVLAAIGYDREAFQSIVKRVVGDEEYMQHLNI